MADMAQNRTVTYVDLDLNSVTEFWDTLVCPAVQTFSAAPSSFTAFIAAQEVWHLHDWLWHQQRPGVPSEGTAWVAYRNELIANCPELGWLRDVTDASKHRGLSRQPEIIEAKPHMRGGTLMTLGAGRGPHMVFTLVLADGSHLDLAEVLRVAIDYWRTVELSGLGLKAP